MIRKPIKPRSGRKGEASAALNDSTVGYGRPPREHQFKPGRSGNPKGRPKAAKNESTLLREVLNRPVQIRQRGTIRNISTMEAIIRRMVEDALRGNPKSASFLLNRYGIHVAGETNPAPLDQDDREVLEAFLERAAASAMDRTPDDS